MSQLNIFVENLKCGGCANSIIKALSKGEGIHEVEVNVENSEVKVECDGEHRRDFVVTRLIGLGYPEVTPDGGAGNFKLKAKSYISCAIGKMS